MNKIPLVVGILCLFHITTLAGCTRVQTPSPDDPAAQGGKGGPGWDGDQVRYSVQEREQTKPTEPPRDDGPFAEDQTVENKPEKEPTKEVIDVPCGPELLDYPAAGNLWPKHVPRAAKWVPYTSGHPIVMAGDRVWAGDRDNETVVQLDGDTLLKTHVVAVGGKPGAMLTSPDNILHVAVETIGRIARLEKANGSAMPLAAWHVAARIRGLAMNVDGTHLYTTAPWDKKVLVVSAKTGKTLWTSPTDAHPVAVGASISGMLTVVHRDRPMRTYTPGQWGKEPVSLLPLDGQQVALGGTRLLHGPLPVGLPVKIASALVSAGLKVPWAPFEVPHLATAIDIDPHDGTARIAHQFAHPGTPVDSVLARLPGKDKQPGGYGGAGGINGGWFDQPRPIDPAITQVNMKGKRTGTDQAHMPIVGGPGPPPGTLVKINGKNVFVPKGQEGWHRFSARLSQPVDLRHHPNRALLFVVGQASDSVLVLHTDVSENKALVPIAELRTGPMPRGIAIAPHGLTAWVLNGGDLSVSRFDLTPLLAATPPPPGHHLKEKTSGKPEKPVFPLQLCSEQDAAFAASPLTQLQQDGRVLFHKARQMSDALYGHQVACGNCHPDGSEDGVVWHVPDGPRQTPHLLGRLAGTAPFNWKGTHHQVEANMAETAERLRIQPLGKEEAEAIDAWLKTGDTTLSSPYVGEKGLTEQQAEGKAVFESAEAGCAGCHLGTGVDGTQHKVGTTSESEQLLIELPIAVPESQLLTMQHLYNTPSLKGLWRTAPYLHDGSAPTLAEMLQKTGDKMGKTSHLSNKQKAALIAYLRTM